MYSRNRTIRRDWAAPAAAGHTNRRCATAAPAASASAEPSALRGARPGPPRTGLRPWGGDALYPVLADSPACRLQLHRDPAVAVAAILAGQRDDGPGQCIFVVTLCRLVALRAAWLLHQLARMSLAHSTLTGMAHRTTPSLRA